MNAAPTVSAAYSNKTLVRGVGLSTDDTDYIGRFWPQNKLKFSASSASLRALRFSMMVHNTQEKLLSIYPSPCLGSIRELMKKRRARRDAENAEVAQRVRCIVKDEDTVTFNLAKKNLWIVFPTLREKDRLNCL